MYSGGILIKVKFLHRSHIMSTSDSLNTFYFILRPRTAGLDSLFIIIYINKSMLPCWENAHRNATAYITNQTGYQEISQWYQGHHDNRCGQRLTTITSRDSYWCNFISHISDGERLLPGEEGRLHEIGIKPT